MPRPGQFQPGQPRPEGAGRQKGTPNRVTKELKSIIEDLIDRNSANVAMWLEQVAFGKPAVYEPDPVDPKKSRLVMPAIEPDPGKALELIAKLGEYAAPKLARTEMTGPGGTALVPPSLHVSVNGRPVEQHHRAAPPPEAG